MCELEVRRAAANPRLEHYESANEAFGRRKPLGDKMSKTLGRDYQHKRGLLDLPMSRLVGEAGVALLTGGADKPYAFGLAMALISKGMVMDLIGSDELDSRDFHSRPGVRFLNLRGDQQSGASFIRKASRVLTYYGRLIRYAATAEPKIFHILWNNKFEFFDRTLLMLYYKLLRKKVILTLHNVNAGRRDSRDTRLNRLTLRIQYRLADSIFVHTERMRLELIQEFGEKEARVTVIPFGINNAVPRTDLTSGEARRRLGIRKGERTILFFGNIAPYKGLEYLISAFRQISNRRDDYRLIIAGRPKNCESYWTAMKTALEEDVRRGRVLLRAEFIPDEETEKYFKAADVFVLPYRHIYQSGVLFLGHSFGLPVIVADVGSLKSDIVVGKTGFVFKPEDPDDLARTIEYYFASDLYKDLDNRRKEIRADATESHSWDKVSQITVGVYAGLLDIPYPSESLTRAAENQGD
jgi:D-inositol-3-phosphate glycosyltransferase